MFLWAKNSSDRMCMKRFTENAFIIQMFNLFVQFFSLSLSSLSAATSEPFSNTLFPSTSCNKWIISIYQCSLSKQNTPMLHSQSDLAM